MSNVREIARQAGVSVATVSRVLNNKPNVTSTTRDRVLGVAERVGYVRPIRGLQSRSIGIAYTGDYGKADYGGFDSSLLKGVLEGLNDHRFDVSIINIARDKHESETYRAFFARKGVAGVILRTFDQSRDICVRIAEEGIPSIVVADRFENPAVNFICTESHADSVRAVRHLLDLGHRRIAIAVHAVGNVSDRDHRDRLNGYREALSDAGLSLDQSLEVQIVANMEGGANAINYLHELPEPPTAVYFTDPLATLGALLHCRQRGIRVPDDLSIVGFDDSDVRFHTFPPFTAVCQDASYLGAEAARWLTARCVNPDGDAQSKRLVLPTRFEINQTTAQPSRR